MGFGRFKKLKDAFIKARKFLSRALPKISEGIKTVKPIVQELSNQQPRFRKVNDLLSSVDDGLDVADDVINHNNTDRMIDWVHKELKPRLKNKSLI